MKPRDKYIIILSALVILASAIWAIAGDSNAQQNAGSSASAQLVSYGTDKGTFSRGEHATGYMTIKNTGSTVINDVTTSVSASKALPLLGQTTLGSKDFTFSNLNIKPGETRRVEFKADIPSEYMGVSTAGDYTIHVTVRTGGTDIGSFSKSVKIA